jgi:hypothetical protein
MAFYINAITEVELTVEEVAIISVAISAYLEAHGKKMEAAQIKKWRNLAERITSEMYNHPDNQKPNGH